MLYLFYFIFILNFSEKSKISTIYKSENQCCSIDDINNNNLIFPGELEWTWTTSKMDLHGLILVTANKLVLEPINDKI